MKIENLVDLKRTRGISGFLFAHGSFGIIDGASDYVRTQEENKITYRLEQNEVALVAEFTQYENGVVIRHDYLENLSDKPIEINGLCSRFCMDGSDYEVYTQYSGWQHESKGAWQKLVTQITAAGQGIRSCDSAAPMMALHNCYTGKNTVFHLMPNAHWKINARKFPVSEKEIVVVEAGFNNENMRLSAAVGERIHLPTILFFDAKSKTDLDAYKLHEVYHKLYPRKKMPVIYNSWLYCFDNLDIDALLKQVDTAAELGFEAFMIDAGWFGDGDGWWGSVGDWEENTVGGPKGRLIEISNRVREHGMVFGLWFEPERAYSKSKAVTAHPEYYINNAFLDFANPEAVQYMVDVLSKQIEKYNIGWVKFDFNDSITLDPSGNAFYRYLKGQRQFVETLQKRFPDLYFTNCAGGGFRMDLNQGSMFDSFWFSDNQGPFGGLRIIKDTFKRMPPALIERWNVQKYAEGFPKLGQAETTGIMFSCNDATWEEIVKVDDTFTENFLTTGPLGFSCDIAAFPQHYKEYWKSRIAQYKQERDFYMNATARILVDTNDIVAIQYADVELKHVVLHLFTTTTYARDLILYPVVNEQAQYQIDGIVQDGKELVENGIHIENLKNNSCRTLKLTNK